MRSLLSISLIVILGQVSSAQTVVFWDEEATIGTDGKYHGGLHFTQDNVYVEYVSWSSGPTFEGGHEVHVCPLSSETGTIRNCERMHDEKEILVLSPERAPRHKLKSLNYQYDKRTLAAATLYVFVGNKGALVPTTEPGGEGWYKYEVPIAEGRVPDERGRIRLGKVFAEFDFQSQDSPPPRGERFYIAFDNKANLYIDDIRFVR